MITRIGRESTRTTDIVTAAVDVVKPIARLTVQECPVREIVISVEADSVAVKTGFGAVDVVGIHIGIAIVYGNAEEGSIVHGFCIDADDATGCVGIIAGDITARSLICGLAIRLYPCAVARRHIARCHAARRAARTQQLDMVIHRTLNMVGNIECGPLRSPIHGREGRGQNSVGLRVARRIQQIILNLDDLCVGATAKVT